MKLTIYPITALQDNYIWAIVNETKKCALIVDPGEAEPVIRFLKKHHLTLKGILITHHHWDHTNGISELIKHHPVPVFASARCNNREINHDLVEHQLVELESFPSFQVIDIPGHTLDHIAYYTPGMLFCGDTLFSAGCGRLFEGTMEQLYTSLQKMTALPDDTRIYCAHEYTQNNLRFAQQVEPDNLAINQHIKSITTLRNNNEPTLPSSIRLEKEINPFLRCHVASVIQQVERHAGKRLTQDIDVFRALREWKDTF